MSSDIIRHSENCRMSLAVEAGGFVVLAALTAVETRGDTVTEQTKEILQRIWPSSRRSRHKQGEAHERADMADRRQRDIQ